jgi:hypothetical protein
VKKPVSSSPFKCNLQRYTVGVAKPRRATAFTSYGSDWIPTCAQGSHQGADDVGLLLEERRVQIGVVVLAVRTYNQGSHSICWIAQVVKKNVGLVPRDGTLRAVMGGVMTRGVAELSRRVVVA